MWILVFALLGLVEPAANLQLTARQARETGQPILLYVSRSDCTFCRRFEVQVLQPLIRSGVLEGRILVRELVWDLPGTVTDFSGRAVAPQAIAEAYRATLTPTLLFLDDRGTEIVPRITGYRESDYFSYYLESAVERAVAALGQPLEHQPPTRGSP